MMMDVSGRQPRGLYRIKAVRGTVVEKTQLEGGAEKGKEQGDREDRTAAGEKVRRRCCVGKSGEVARIGVATAAGKGGDLLTLWGDLAQAKNLPASFQDWRTAHFDSP